MPNVADGPLRRVLGPPRALEAHRPPPIAPAVKAALQPPRPQHGPRKYSDEVAQLVLAKMRSGLFLGRICAQPGMPSRDAVLQWCEHDAAFRDAYARARLALADALVERGADILDDDSNDVLYGPHGPIPNNAAVNRAKARADFYRWVASKLYPARYGTQPIVHEGEITHRHVVDRPPNETREQWIERRQRELALPAPQTPP
jgi:hypothetical protein